jgi:hypothetical protein
MDEKRKDSGVATRIK